MQQPEEALVPALVGLSIDEATRLAGAAGVTVETITGPATRGNVTAQQPLAGMTVEPGSAVQVTLDDPGGGGGGSSLVPPPVPLDPSGSGEPAAV